MVVAANPGTPDVEAVTLLTEPVVYLANPCFFVAQTEERGTMEFRYRKMVVLENEDGKVLTDRRSVGL